MLEALDSRQNNRSSVMDSGTVVFVPEVGHLDVDVAGNAGIEKLSDRRETQSASSPGRGEA